jgi:8-oxo-dGTP pyrophosphatase MutT (NUDIX family)
VRGGTTWSSTRTYSAVRRASKVCAHTLILDALPPYPAQRHTSHDLHGITHLVGTARQRSRPGESLTDTARRELTEETSILLDRLGPHLWDRETALLPGSRAPPTRERLPRPAPPAPHPPCGPNNTANEKPASSSTAGGPNQNLWPAATTPTSQPSGAARRHPERRHPPTDPPPRIGTGIPELYNLAWRAAVPADEHD